MELFPKYIPSEEEILQGKLSREDSYLCAVISKLTRPIAPPASNT